ncbi:MAG: ADP-ribosylation factor-like protein [Candidatus Heimdallarchaeaceae archaeon]|jgi:GTPase SAR1 family protein
MSDLRNKLLKDEYKEKEDVKNFPIIAILDITEDEFNFLKELKLETIEDLANNWNERYDKIIKKIPKERVNSWIAASRLLLVGDTDKITTGAKIIMVGIDNAGKTSLSIALKHRGALSLLFQKLYALTPTRGLLRSKIDVFGMDIHIHELGGQNIYREDYLKNPQQYFLGTDIIIFVIDVQAKERFEESFEYLKQIINVANALKLKVPWKIFFHKSDPEYEIDEKTTEIFGSIIDYMTNNCPYYNSAKDLFRTSVKIRSSILGAFSHIFREISLIQSGIAEASEEVAKQLKADFFGLYDFRSNVCFAQYAEQEELDDLAHTAYYEAIETIVNMREPFLRIRRYTLDKDVNEIFILRDLRFHGDRYIMAMFTQDEEMARSLDQDAIQEIIEEQLEDWIEFRGYAAFPLD